MRKARTQAQLSKRLAWRHDGRRRCRVCCAAMPAGAQRWAANVQEGRPARVRWNSGSGAHARDARLLRCAKRTREAVLGMCGDFQAGRMGCGDVKPVVAAWRKRGQLDAYLPVQVDECAPEEAAAHVAARDFADQPSARGDPASSASGAALAAAAAAAAEAQGQIAKLHVELAGLPVQ